MYVENPLFRQAVDSGRYTYVDGRIVLNSSRYIRFDNGYMTLRDDIKEDTHLYCLHYRQEIEWIGRDYRHGIQHRRRRGFADSRYPKVWRMAVPAYPTRKLLKSELEDAKRISSVNDVSIENMIAIVGSGHGPGENFAEALARFMDESCVTEEMLAELTGLAPKTIQRMRNPQLRSSLKSVIAICIALSLDLYNSMYLIHLAGFELTNSREDKVYYFILGFAYKDTVYDCNRMLERLQMKPLTKL